MAAIYMWRVDEQLLLTTTLYPAEAVESMNIGATIVDGAMPLIPWDALQTYNDDLKSISYTQVRWFYEDGPYDDALETTDDLLSMSYTQVRWFYEDGPYEDGLVVTSDLRSITYTLKGVLADAELEKLYLGARITTDCSMELI